MKIAIVVQGRFFAFDLANSLRRRGHSVTVLTNYPVFACRRFGLEGVEIRTFPTHGVLSRLANRFSRQIPLTRTEPLLHQLFGRWATRSLRSRNWDCILSFSGISEELLDAASKHEVRTLLIRGSAHIVEQARLLTEEAERTHAILDIPSKWMIDREQREYEKAGGVVTLSSFAYQSFVERRFPEQKLHMLPLGVDVEAFRAAVQVVQDRRTRILSGGEPLRLLYVGNVTYQK